jgi:hypothetical protein
VNDHDVSVGEDSVCPDILFRWVLKSRDSICWCPRTAVDRQGLVLDPSPAALSSNVKFRVIDECCRNWTVPQFRSYSVFVWPYLLSGYFFRNSSSSKTSWFPAMATLYWWGCDESHVGWFWISSKDPFSVRSPA